MAARIAEGIDRGAWRKVANRADTDLGHAGYSGVGRRLMTPAAIS
jgi:hypothetical protein